MDDIFTGYDWGGLSIIEAKRLLRTGRPEFIHDRVSTSFYQLGAKFSGRTTVYYDGKTYDYAAGTILFLPKETRTDIIYDRDIVVPGEGAYVFFDSARPLFDRPTILPLAGIPQVKELFLKTANLFAADRMACMAGFYKLLAKLRDESRKVDGGARSRLSPAIDYISEHICDDYIDLSVLASLCGMTPEYFRHSFSRVFRVPPLQYINSEKLELSKELLSDRSLSISEVAKRLGFSGGSYFARFFREHTGMSPSQYRSGILY